MIIQSKILSLLPGTRHGFTTRDWENNYDQLEDKINADRGSIVTLKQIHSNKVAIVGTRLQVPTVRDTVEADAIITNQTGIVLAIKTADCVPIFVFDPVKNVVANIHAGWKGIISGIVENTFQKLREEFQTQSEDCLVSIGPAICGKCFEVGDEVALKFHKKFGTEISIEQVGEKSHVDLREAVQFLLSREKVKQYDQIDLCTLCHKDRLFSFRGGDKEKRNLSIIGLK